MEKFELCLFDLDDTLIKTSFIELNSIRVNMVNAKNATELNNYLNTHMLPSVSSDFIENIINEFPKMKLGIYSRAPSLYVKTMLLKFFPKINWDIIISYEDVKPYFKPNPQGVYLAMKNFKISDPKKVIIVGDSICDIKVANNSGAKSFLWQNYFSSLTQSQTLKKNFLNYCNSDS